MSEAQIIQQNPPHLSNNSFLVQLAVTFHVVSIPLALFILISIFVLIMLLATVIVTATRHTFRQTYLHKRVRPPLKSFFLEDLALVLPDDIETDLGTLEYSVEYNIDRKKLYIGVVRAIHLTPRPGFSHCDAYARVSAFIERGQKFYLIEPRHLTSVRKHTRDPIWRELFHYNLTEEELNRTSILFEMFDKDSIGQDACLGKLSFAIRDTEAVKYCGQMWETFDRLQPSKMYVDGIGELCVGLCHLPYLNRIDVTIYEVKQLRTSLDPLITENASTRRVSISVQLRKKGRVLGTKKTETRAEIFNPYFNDKIKFIVKNGKHEDYEIICTLRRHLAFGKKETLGTVVIGRQSDTTTGGKHLDAMLHGPLKTHVMWHPLLE